MVIHIVTGDMAAGQVKLALGERKDTEVLVIRDVFNVGPLKKAEGERFSGLRSAFWNTVGNNEKQLVAVDDLERLLAACNELSKFETWELCIWMGALPADVCTYYLVLKYAAKYAGRLKVINIAGLPFLDDNGKLYFPRSIAELNEREVTKALKLERTINNSELEIDGSEWDKLVQEDGGIRTLDGSKRITSRRIDHFDDKLFAVCSDQFQKAARVIAQAMQQFEMFTGDSFLGWRLREMAAAGRLQLQGDPTKGLRDFEVKRHDGTLL